MRVDFIHHGALLHGPLTLACLPKRVIDATKEYDPNLEERENENAF